MTILYVAMPLIKLLRLLDGNKPAIGKVYDRMFTISERINTLQSTISWAPAMAKIHADRWEYLHSDFHAAAYALDPEYLETVWMKLRRWVWWRSSSACACATSSSCQTTMSMR